MPISRFNTRGLFILSLCFSSILTACAGGSGASGVAQLPTTVDFTSYHNRRGSTPTPTPKPTSTSTSTSTSTPISSPNPTITSSATGQQASSSDAFVDSIGVNTHYFDGGSQYDTAGAEAALENLGVRHIRDQSGETSQDHHYITLASYGIHFDMFWEPNYQSERGPEAYAATIGLSNLDSYEGENEQNVACSGDVSWVSDVTTLQSSLWNGMKAGGLSALPVIAPSYGNCGAWTTLISNANAMGTSVAQYSTYGNAHAYAGQSPPEQGGYTASQSSSGGTPNSYQGIALLEAPGKPIVITEAGYGSDASGNDDGVGTVGQERYTLRELLNFWNEGVHKSYIYALLDDTNPTAPWGLLNSSYVAKPSYTALKNLIATLTDPGATFSAGKLNCTLGGTLTNIDQTLLEKRNGTFEYILWRAVASINSSAGPLTIASQTVTLTLANAPTSIVAQTFTNTGALTPVTVTQAGSVESVPVNDIPVIVSITL